MQRCWDDSDPRRTSGQLPEVGIRRRNFRTKLVSTIVQNFKTFNERGSTMFFQHSGGAIGRVPADATAFAHRKSVANMFAVVAVATWLNPAIHTSGTSRSTGEEFEPFTDGWYTNDIADESTRPTR